MQNAGAAGEFKKMDYFAKSWPGAGRSRPQRKPGGKGEVIEVRHDERGAGGFQLIRGKFA